MAPVVDSRQWIVSGHTDLAVSIARVLNQTHGLTLEDRISAQGARLRGGSNLVTRLLGAGLVRDRLLPKRVTVRVDHGERVTVTFESTLRWGIMDRWTKRKYERLFNKIGDDIDAALHSNGDTEITP